MGWKRSRTVSEGDTLRQPNNILGAKKGQKPWLSRNSWKLVEERKHLKQKITNSKCERVKGKLKSKYCEKDKEIKRSMRNGRRKWTEDLMNEAERAASNGHVNALQSHYLYYSLNC
jgi:hypothetical protein